MKGWGAAGGVRGNGGRMGGDGGWGVLRGGGGSPWVGGPKEWGALMDGEPQRVGGPNGGGKGEPEGWGTPKYGEQ